MPSVPFNATVWPASVKPLASNAEIVRVTNVSGDTLTITRAQEGTAAISIAVGYQFSATITAKTLTDAELNITDGTGNVPSGTLRFSNANGVSFGLNGSTMTASHNALTTAALSNHSHGNPQLNLTNLSGTTASNSAGFTLSLSAANPSGGAFSAGVSNVGNTGGDTGVSGTRLVLVGSQNITLNQATDANGLTVSFSGGAGAAGNTGFISAGAATASLGTVVFSNSNGVSFGANGQTVTASHNGLTTARASNDAVGLNTALTAGPLAWTVNSAGISLNAGSAAGTTSGFAGNLISGSMTHDTAGLNVSLNHPAWLTTAMASNAATLSNIRVSAGTTSNLLSALTFADGNGVSFGLNASTMTASHNGLTSQSNQNVTAANGGFAFQTLSFSNLNGISFGTSAGSAITASHNALTTARASNDAVGLNTALTAGPLAWTVNSSGLSLNAGSAAGTTSGFGGNLISGSMTHNTAGLNLSLNHPAWLTTAALSNHSHGNPTLNLTNLSGTTASNSAGFTLSLSAGAGGGVTPVASASNGSFSFTTLAFSNANNVTFGTSAGSIITASVAAPGAAAENNNINLLGANTAGNTTASGSTIGYSGINLTLSGTNGSVVNISAPATSSLSATGLVSISTNGSTISIGAGRTISGLALVPFAGAGGPLPFAQSSISLGQNSLYIYPVQIEDYLTLDHVRMPVLITNSSSAVSSGQKGQTFRLGVYSRNATNNTILTQLWSTSYTIAASYSSNASWAQSMITAIGNSTSYNSVTASSAGLNLSASLHGPRELIWPVSTLLSPGDYWVAVAASTSGSGTVGNVLNISNLAVAYQTYNSPGLSTSATHSGWFKFMGAGTYSTTTGALPNGISATQINQLGTLPIMFAATGTV